MKARTEIYQMIQHLFVIDREDAATVLGWVLGYTTDDELLNKIKGNRT